MKIGFIGLGQMGRPIALNLLKSGADLMVSDLSDRHFEAFRAAGAKATTEIAEIAEADLIFLCLPNAKVVQATLLGDAGLLARLSPHQTIIDLSTITYAATTEIAAAAAARGVDFLDAPVSGMPIRAEDGTLTVMCGGTQAVFDRVRPTLAHIGATILFMGPSGSGQLTKLINQLLYDINAAAVAEVLPMAMKMGLDPELVGEVVNNSSGRSYASEYFIPRILRGHFTDGYPMQDAYKDLVSAAELQAQQCVPMPVLAAATATYQTALRHGLGAQDKGAMIQVFEKLLGLEFRGKGFRNRT